MQGSSVLPISACLSLNSGKGTLLKAVQRGHGRTETPLNGDLLSEGCLMLYNLESNILAASSSVWVISAGQQHCPSLCWTLFFAFLNRLQVVHHCLGVRGVCYLLNGWVRYTRDHWVKPTSCCPVDWRVLCRQVRAYHPA